MKKNDDLKVESSPFPQNYEKAKEILNKYHQEHLLMFFDELDANEKETLINQICSINFEQIFKLYEASKIDEVIPNNEIKPLDYTIKAKLTKDELNFFSCFGDEVILKKKVRCCYASWWSRHKAWL